MISRARFITKAIAVTGFLLAFSAPALAGRYPYHRNVVRAGQPCGPDSLLGQVGPGNGGRKIGLVIDASGSMATNDPDDIRLDAAKALVDVLVSKSEAGGDKCAWRPNY